MNLLFVADGRSPIALNWIRYFADTPGQPHHVHLISTFPCPPPLNNLASFRVIPAAFSQAAGRMAESGRGSRLRALTTPRLRTALRQWLGPLTLPWAAHRLADAIRTLAPDLVHAMRIPYEGILTALADPAPPLLVSLWGNDLTLHARSNPILASLTRRTLARAHALHTDCQRDARLARAWGFAAEKPVLTVPGNGGLDLNVFHPPAEGLQMASAPTVIHPRGFRAYVRNDTFFQAVPIVLKTMPTVRFICPAMAEHPQAREHLRALQARNQAHAVELLPSVPHQRMAELFRQAQIVVSPSEHDGTPNTLLEAMACGCLPVVGDLESVREWIAPGENGLLFPPDDPQACAQALLRGLSDAPLRARAAQKNARLIAARADYHQVMPEVEVFYRRLIPGRLPSRAG